MPERCEDLTHADEKCADLARLDPFDLDQTLKPIEEDLRKLRDETVAQLTWEPAG